METSLAKWEKQMAPYKGTQVVTYHKNFVYFATRFGLKIFETVENKPGIPPSPRHVADLVEAMEGGGQARRLSALLQRQSVQGGREAGGRRRVEIATECDGLPGTDDVFTKFDLLVSSIAKALSEK